MTDTYDFKPETIKIIMAGLKPEIRLNENNTEETYMVPQENATEQQIIEATTTLKQLVESILDPDKKIYIDGVSAIETLQEPLMYRGADLEAMNVIDDIASDIQEEQNRLDMDIIRSVYTLSTDNGQTQFKMLDHQTVNQNNIERALTLLNHHFGVEIPNNQPQIPLITKAVRQPILDVPADLAKYAIQMMNPEAIVEQPIKEEMQSQVTEEQETIEHPIKAASIPTISSELEKELDEAFEKAQAERSDKIAQVAKAYEVAQTEHEGTYFRPRKEATAEDLAAGEKALRDLTEEKLKDKRLPNKNVIIPMGAMNQPKMFRANGADAVAIFNELGAEINAVPTPQTQAEKEAPQETAEIDMPDFPNTMAQPIEVEPLVQQVTLQRDTVQPPLKAEDRLMQHTIKTAATLEKNFVVVAGNLEARPWVLPEQIEDIKKQLAPLLATKDIVKEGRVIGLEPTNPDQADIMFQMMEAAKATRAVLAEYPDMEQNPQDILKIFSDQFTQKQTTPQQSEQTEENVNGTIVNRVADPKLVADLNDEQSMEAQNDELPLVPPTQLVDAYTQLGEVESTPETEQKKEAIGKQMDKVIADYVSGETVIDQDNIADVYEGMDKILKEYGSEDKNAAIARERLDKEMALYDDNNNLTDLTTADESRLANRVEEVKNALESVELDPYYTNLQFYDADKNEIPQLNETGQIRSDSELAQLINVVKANVLTDMTLAKDPISKDMVAQQANEAMQINTVALMAADLKRTGKDPALATEQLDGLKNGQKFAIPQETMAGFVAANVNKQQGLINRLSGKLGKDSGVVQQLNEPVKELEATAKERYGTQYPRTNLLKACLKKFALGSMAGALAGGAGLGAAALTLPAVPVVAGVMAAYTGFGMWRQRKREVEKAKTEGKERPPLKEFFKKNTVRALLSGASLGAIAMGVPAVALGIGAAAAAVGFKGIFRRNRQEGYDIKTSILRSIPESVAAVAGSMMTGGLIHGVTDPTMANTLEQPQPTLEIVDSQIQTGFTQTDLGTEADIEADTGTTDSDSTGTTDSDSTGTSQPIEETIQQSIEGKPIDTEMNTETVETEDSKTTTEEEPAIDQTIAPTELDVDLGTDDMAGDEIADDQNPFVVDLDPNSSVDYISSDALSLEDTPETTKEQSDVEIANITQEQRDALVNDDFAEEITSDDQTEVYEEAVPMAETSNDPAATYDLSTPQNLDDAMVRYDIETQAVVTEAPTVAPELTETHLNGEGISNDTDQPTTLEHGSKEGVNDDTQAPPPVTEVKVTHHSYSSDAHELAQARLNGEGIYDAHGRPTTPDYTPTQLAQALDHIESLGNTFSELSGADGTSNADILMYKLVQFNKLAANSTDLNIDGTHISIDKAYGVQLDNGQTYTPEQLQADLLEGKIPPISPEQTAEMLGKVELSISTKGHFNKDIVNFQESGKWSYKPGMDPGFTVEEIVQKIEKPEVDLTKISAPEITLPDIKIDIQPDIPPVPMEEINIDLNEPKDIEPVEEVRPEPEEKEAPFVPFVPYEKAEEDKDKTNGLKANNVEQEGETADLVIPQKEGQEANPDLNGITVNPITKDEMMAEPAPKEGQEATQTSSQIGAHFDFADVQKEASLDGNQNVFTFNMSNPNNDMAETVASSTATLNDLPIKETDQPSPEDLQAQYKNLCEELAKLEKQMTDIGIPFEPVTEKTGATNESAQVEAPIIPQVREESVKEVVIPTLTETEQKAVEAIVNPVATPAGIEAEIKQDMLKVASVETAPKKSIRETLMGIAKLNLLRRDTDKTSASSLKKEPQDKQPFFNGLFKKRGQGK